MARYVGYAVDQYGRDIPGAYVTVVAMDGDPATLTDDFGNPISQPLRTDDYGGYYFNTDDGLYTITTTRSGEVIAKEYNVVIGILPTTDGFQIALAAEASARVAGDTLVAYNANVALQAEITRAISAEQSETARATLAEGALDTRITTNTNDISDLKSEARFGDTINYKTYALAIADFTAYNSATAYTAGKRVIDQGALWTNILGSTNVPPPTLPTTSNANWILKSNPVIGTPIVVPITDTGTHTDPTNGATVNNTGVHEWTVGTSGTGFHYLFPTDAELAKPYADAAAASAAAAAASAAAVYSPNLTFDSFNELISVNQKLGGRNWWNPPQSGSSAGRVPTFTTSSTNIARTTPVLVGAVNTPEVREDLISDLGLEIGDTITPLFEAWFANTGGQVWATFRDASGIAVGTPISPVTVGAGNVTPSFQITVPVGAVRFWRKITPPATGGWEWAYNGHSYGAVKPAIGRGVIPATLAAAVQAANGQTYDNIWRDSEFKETNLLIPTWPSSAQNGLVVDGYTRFAYNAGITPTWDLTGKNPALKIAGTVNIPFSLYNRIPDFVTTGTPLPVRIPITVDIGTTATIFGALNTGFGTSNIITTNPQVITGDGAEHPIFLPPLTTTSSSTYYMVRIVINSGSGSVRIGNVALAPGQETPKLAEDRPSRFLAQNASLTASRVLAACSTFSAITGLTTTTGQFVTGTGVITSQAGFQTTSFVPVPGAQHAIETNISGYPPFAAYFQNGVCIGAEDNRGGFTTSKALLKYPLTIPEGCDQVIVNGTTAGPTNVYVGTLNTNIGGGGVSKWAGTKFTSYGDSNEAFGLWQPAVIAEHSLTGFTNCGVGGTKIAWLSPADDGQSMCEDARIATIPTDTGLLDVGAGTNDWAQSVPMGTISDNVRTTFYGALNLMYGKLQIRAPNARIMQTTLPVGQFVYPSGRPGWTDQITNGQGLTYLDYAVAQRLCAQKWGLPVIDWTAENGINQANITQFMNVETNGSYIHFNTDGAKRAADVTIGRLYDLQPW